MRGNNIRHQRQPQITQGWTLVESHFKSLCFRIKPLHVQFPTNLTTAWQWISTINLIYCLLKNTNYFNLLCLKLDAVEVLHATSPVLPPTCTFHQSGQTNSTLHPTPTHIHSISSHLLTHSLPWTARDSKRGSKTQSDSRQRSDFSLGMSLGFGHKSHWIHIFQLGPGFCPGKWKTREWALQQTSPSWSALSGAAKRLARRPFDWCTPAMSHAQQHTLTCIHNPPCPQHSPAWTIQYPQTASNEKPHSFFWKVMVSPPKMAAWGPEGCNAWMTNLPSCGQCYMNRIHPANHIVPKYQV